MRMGNYRRRKKLTARIAAMLAAVLVLSEVPVESVYAIQLEQTVEEKNEDEGNSTSEVKEVEEESRIVTESEESVDEGNGTSEAEEVEGENSIVAESEESVDEGNSIAETEEAESEKSTVAEEEESSTELQTEATVEENETTAVEADANKVSSAETAQLDYTFGRELTEEEIEKMKAMEPVYLPEMEVFELPKATKIQQPLLDGVASVSLEESYDARELGILNEVRNQTPWGTCWSFATLGIMESALIKEGEVKQGELDLSERHLAYFVGHTGYDELGNASGDTITTSPATYYLDRGGNIYYATMKLMNWQGGAAESEYPYVTSSDVPDLAVETAQDDVAHIENCYWLETTPNDAETIQAVKTMIQQYGCVLWTYYSNTNYMNYSTSSYYNYVNTSTNHAIMVVGWDDTYSKENFGIAGDATTQPANDGAWIVRNSWGSGWGEGGYFYISYEDTSLGSGNAAAAMTANLADDYDNNYFYSNTATYGYYTSGMSKVSQVYRIKGKETEKEQIRAVSFMLLGTNTEYSIQIYKNPELENGVVTNPASGEAMLTSPVTGTTTYAGLYTVNLPNPVALSTDDYAAIVITFPNQDGFVLFDMTKSGSSGSIVWNEVNQTAAGQSFYGDGNSSWVDLHKSGYSFRVNMLTDNVNMTQAPEIKDIMIKEPGGFGGVVEYKISWDTCKDATGYEVYRSESEEGTYTKIDSVNEDAVYYTDSIEKANWKTKYYYKIRAVFSENDYKDSEPVSAQAEGILHTTLNSASCSNDTTTLNWKAMDGAEGYYIERKEKGETEFEQIAEVTVASTTTYADDITELELGYYEYRVQAYAGTEKAEWSETEMVAKDLRVTPVSSGKIKVEWLPVEGTALYKAYVITNSKKYEWKLYTVKLEDTAEYTLDISEKNNLKVGDTLGAYLEAYDADSKLLSASQTVYFNTKPDSLNLSVSYNNGIVHFAWTGGAGADAIYIYKSMDGNNPGDEPVTVITDTTLCEYEDSTFPSMGTYYYWLYPGVTNSSGEIVYGEGSTYQCKVTPSVKITDITKQTENSLKISWNAIADADSYTIYRCEEEAGTYTTLADSLTATEYIDATVTAGKTYYYKVQYIADGEASELGAAIPEKGQTIPDAPVLISKTYDSITIENNTEFFYAIGEADDTVSELVYIDSKEESIVFTGLKPETIYYVYARTKQENTGETPVYGKSLEVVTEKYPIAKTDELSAVNPEVEIEAYYLRPDSRAMLQIQNQQGEIQKAELFSFVSENTSVCLVSEDGLVTANPTFAGKKDTKVKITAKAVNDPANREVVFYVTVLTKKYVDSLEIIKIPNADEGQETERIDTFWGQKFVKGETLTFGAVAYDRNGEKIDNPALSWSLSDTSVASLKVNRDGTATVTLKKAARFNLTCKSKDARQSKKVIQVGALITEPVISTSQVTLNKKAVQNSEIKCSTAFTVSPRNGALAKVPEITEIKIGKKVLTEETGLKQFEIVPNEDGSYGISITDEFLETIKNNTVYTITVETKINGIPELSINENVTESFNIKLKVISKEPSVTVKAAGINRFYVQENDLEGLLTIKAPDMVTSVRVLTAQEGQINSFDSYFSAEEKEGRWYLQFADLSGQYNKKSISGKLEITVNGYEPVVKTIAVKTTATQLSVKQQSVPVIHTAASEEVSISLYNNTEKTMLDNLKIQSVESTTLEAEAEEDGTITLCLKENANYKDGATLQAKLSIMAQDKEERNRWTKPVTVTVKVKVYNKKSPAISMKTTKFVLNKQTEGEMAETTLGTNCVNVSILPDSEWQLYAYNSKTKKYDSQGDGFTDWIQMTYDEENGTVKAGFAISGDAILPGTYKFRLSGLVEDFEEVSKDFTVSVIDKNPTITVKTSGKLDLVKRADCTLTGKLTLKNIPSEVIGVSVWNEDRTAVNAYYQAELVNSKQFKISMTEAGLEAAMTTDKVILPVELELQGGQKIQSTMTFKPVQSVPAIKVPAARTLYKSMPDSEADYDMSIGQTVGTKIKKIEVVSVPTGIDATTEGGHLVVKLNDRGIKKGSYKIKVNIYFEGAQAVKGNADGKPVVKTVTVKVAE